MYYGFVINNLIERQNVTLLADAPSTFATDSVWTDNEEGSLSSVFGSVDLHRFTVALQTLPTVSKVSFSVVCPCSIKASRSYDLTKSFSLALSIFSYPSRSPPLSLSHSSTPFSPSPSPSPPLHFCLITVFILILHLWVFYYSLSSPSSQILISWEPLQRFYRQYISRFIIDFGDPEMFAKSLLLLSRFLYRVTTFRCI